MTTAELKDAVELAGYQFLKDKEGWACYDADDRTEVPGCRHRRLGDCVHLAAQQLEVGEQR